MTDVDRDQAIAYLLRFLAVEGTTGHEGAIGEEIAAALRELDVPDEAIRFDGAERRIPVPTETGNLIVDVAGDPSLPRRMFSTHRDTVPLCAGAKPVLAGDRVVPAGPDGARRRRPHRRRLPGDHAGDAAARAAAASAVDARLHGARGERPVGRPLPRRRRCSAIPRWPSTSTAASADVLTVGAVGAARWEVEITGKAAHAGLHPEEGISAPMVAALALAAVQRRGWFGRIRRRGGGAGTSNVGSIGRRRRRSRRRPHQRRHRLRQAQGRGAQPRRALRAAHRRRLSARLRGGGAGTPELDGRSRAGGVHQPPAVPPVPPRRGERARALRHASARRPSGWRPSCASPTAASTPTGSPTTASRPSPSAPASAASTPSRSTWTSPTTSAAAGWRSLWPVAEPRRLASLAPG